MTEEQKVRERIRKIAALFEGATTPGERTAAASALDRLRAQLAELERKETPREFRFKLPDLWQRRLFTALCRRYGLEPFRYKRQRFTTVMLRAPKAFVENTLWPEYLELRLALNEYLESATERIIREEVFGDARDAAERP